MNSGIQFKGIYTLTHERNGEVLWNDKVENLIVDEGLIYILNTALGVSVGGAPTPIPQFYIGLSAANRAWQSTDKAVDIITVAQEVVDYSETARPSWTPQALAMAGTVSLSNSGSEAVYTLTADATIYSAFLISASSKTSSGDASATLISGKEFTTQRTLLNGDVFRVGYDIVASSV